MCNRQPVESDVHMCTTYVVSVVLHWFRLTISVLCWYFIFNHTKFNSFMLSNSLQKTHCGWLVWTTFILFSQPVFVVVWFIFILPCIVLFLRARACHTTCPCLHLPDLLSFYHMTDKSAQKSDYLIYYLPPFIIRSASVIQKGRTDLHFGSL